MYSTAVHGATFDDGVGACMLAGVPALYGTEDKRPAEKIIQLHYFCG